MVVQYSDHELDLQGPTVKGFGFCPKCKKQGRKEFVMHHWATNLQTWKVSGNFFCKKHHGTFGYNEVEDATTQGK